MLRRAVNSAEFTTSPVMYADDGGNRPVELTEVNTHTMQQVSQTTQADLYEEYQRKKQEAIARSQGVEIDRIRDMKEDDIKGSDNTDDDGVNNPADTLEEVIGNCSFDQINSMIYDDMNFSIYSVGELQALYDKMDSLDLGKKAYDNVNNANKFMRQLKRYKKNNTPKEEYEYETPSSPLQYQHPEGYYYQKIDPDDINYGDMDYELRSIYHSSLSNYYSLKGLTAAIGEQLPEYDGYVESLNQELSRLREDISKQIGWLVTSNSTTIIAAGLTVGAIVLAIAAVVGSGGVFALAMPAIGQAIAAAALASYDDYILLWDALVQFKPVWKEYRENLKELKSIIKGAEREQHKAQTSYDFYQAAEEKYKVLIKSIENGTYEKGDERDVWQATELPNTN